MKIKKRFQPSPNPQVAGIYKVLRYNDMGPNKTGPLVSKFTGIKLDSQQASDAAAANIQTRWKEFTKFVEAETGKKLIIPRKGRVAWR